jgi:hypothetical protein
MYLYSQDLYTEIKQHSSSNKIRQYSSNSMQKLVLHTFSIATPCRQGQWAGTEHATRGWEGDVEEA